MTTSRPSTHLIYVPKGRAREYAALACNTYRGCAHGCAYCYAPAIVIREKMTDAERREQFKHAQVRPGDFLNRLEWEAAMLKGQGVTGQVLLSFTCDPFQPLEDEFHVSRETIKILHHYGFTVSVLTKAPHRAIVDAHLFSPKDSFGTTLVFSNDADIAKEEPGADTYAQRTVSLGFIHEHGIPTYVSCEPVIKPSQTIEIIKEIHDDVDMFKVGKLNHDPYADHYDWKPFGNLAITVLEHFGYKRILDPDEGVKASASNRLYYIKQDLARLLT